MSLFPVASLLGARLGYAVAAVVATTALTTLVASRIATETDVNDLFFGATRHPAVQLMIDLLGRERSAVVVYLVQRSFDAAIVVTAGAPLFVWLLGSTAIDASARLAGLRRPFAPILVFSGLAAAIALAPGDLVTLAVGVRPGLGAQLAQLVGLLGLAWLAVATYRAIRLHYGVPQERAVRILVIAAVLFYVVPLAVIVAAAVAIVIAGVVLEYF